MRAKGEGTLYKRTITRADGTTYTRWQAGMTAGRKPNGKSYRVYGPLRKTQDEARADLSALRTQVATGVTPSRQRLDDYLRHWVENQPQLKYRTISTYRADIEVHIIPVLGGLRLDEITVAHAQDFVNQALKTKSAAVVRKARATLHAALEAAVLTERLSRNPVSLVKAPPTPRASKSKWKPKHAQAFARACTRNREGSVFLLTLATGLRAGEALGLMWDDLDGDVLKVRRQLRTVGPPVYDTLKTKRSRRNLRLGADVVGMLVDHRLMLAGEGFLSEGEYPHADGWTITGVPMFPDELGRPYRLDRLTPHYREIIADAKVPYIRIHDLRHYNLSRLINLGVDLATASRRAGHSRNSTTSDIYVEAFEDELAQTSVTLEDVIGEKRRK